MPRRSIVLACLLAAFTAGLAAAAPTGARHDRVPSGHPHVAGELIVRFKPGLGQAERRRILGRHEAARKHSLRAPGLELVRLDEASLAGVAAELEREPGVLAAQPNYVYRVSATPNDPRFGELWGLHAANDADMDVPEAWDTATGSAAVTVAVIDTGVTYTHPDLASNIWSNSGEIADGLDNDANGHVDDVRGWDFVEDDAMPTDPHGHGTHVAGTVGAEGNNGVGVTGVNWEVGLMPLRAGDAAGYFTDQTIADAMNYACTEGADVVNGSFGGEGYSPVIAGAIGSCPGTLFVFAAGNGGIDQVGDNIDASQPIYPCAFTDPHVVCVAASNESAGIASFSNYGPVSVDVAAPGTAILSTVNTGGIRPKQRHVDGFPARRGRRRAPARSGSRGHAASGQVLAHANCRPAPGVRRPHRDRRPCQRVCRADRPAPGSSSSAATATPTARHRSAVECLPGEHEPPPRRADGAEHDRDDVERRLRPWQRRRRVLLPLGHSSRRRFFWGPAAIVALVGGSAVRSDAFPGANGRSRSSAGTATRRSARWTRAGRTR